MTITIHSNASYSYHSVKVGANRNISSDLALQLLSMNRALQMAKEYVLEPETRTQSAMIEILDRYKLTLKK